jgi:hypothetical protein
MLIHCEVMLDNDRPLAKYSEPSLKQDYYCILTHDAVVYDLLLATLVYQFLLYVLFLIAHLYLNLIQLASVQDAIDFIDII